METLAMSARERERVGLMKRVAEAVLKLRVAAEMMGVSYRQGKRIWGRYRREGDGGVVHQGRGHSNRARPWGQREHAVELYRQRYNDFGPLLASEHLATEHQIGVDHETLRRWLMKDGAWQPRRRRARHRQARERRPRCGDLVQIDGSEHDWFEGRGEKAVLMVMIDDATNRTLARFYPAEDTASAFDIFARYVRRYGLPAALYPDRDSIYRCTRESRLDEQLADTGPETQFARAMRQLGVQMTPAYSPQAKGRVERRHGLFQDRLVKEMRLRGISRIAAANAYLERSFLRFINGRYVVAAADPSDGHRPRPCTEALDWALCWQEPRTVGRDWTFPWRNRRFQIDPQHAHLGLPGRRVTVVERRDGPLAILYDGRSLSCHPAPARPAPVRPPAPRNFPPLRPKPPAADHPWRIQPAVRRRHRPASRFPPTSYMAHSREAGSQAAQTTFQLVDTK